MTPPCDLAGAGVLVTRPAMQSADLCRLIEAAGGRAVAFPTMEIRPAEDMELVRARLSEPWDLIVFISRNAVAGALALVPPGDPFHGARIAAVGRATADALTQAGHPPDLIPAQRFDSASLLALPELARVSGQRVLIVRGVGGLPLLGETLAERGANVAYAEVYRRAPPSVSTAGLIETWRREIGFVTVTSDEILTNLVDLVEPSARPWLFSLPLVVFSERGAGTAIGLGFRTVAVVREASDEAIVDALCRLLLARRVGR